MRVDLKKQLKFLEEITLKPDIVLWSRASKQVVLLELTVPWEERMEDAVTVERLVQAWNRRFHQKKACG